jgi:hypothetical protein
MLKFELAIIEGKEIKASLCAAFQYECCLRPGQRSPNWQSDLVELNGEKRGF